MVPPNQATQNNNSIFIQKQNQENKNTPFPGANMNGTMYGMGSLGSGADEAMGPTHNGPPMVKDPKLLTKSTIGGDGYNNNGF
jgi:hypothetical protein